jgi:hypothetical protein
LRIGDDGTCAGVAGAASRVAARISRSTLAASGRRATPATFISGISVPTKFRGRSGKHSFTGMITTKEFTPFDQGPGETLDPVLPSEPLVPRAGSWIAQYKFFQYVSEHKAMDGTTTGWGVFGTLVGADGETNKSRGSPTRRTASASPIGTKPGHST